MAGVAFHHGVEAEQPLYTMPSGLPVCYGNWTIRKISEHCRRHRTDVLLAGMQLNFIADVVRGVAALKPKVVVLYPPHEKFHAMMGAVSEPWAAFGDAVRSRFPDVAVHLAEPGFELPL